MNIKVPKVTVLMPVYNGEQYLEEAIDSILSQTYTDYELLIINDGSKDHSEKIIQSYNDQRIRRINNSQNLGLIATLNKGLDLARGEYIARMDQDDISLPDRIEKQVNFMESNQHIGICGTWVEIFGESNSGFLRHPVSAASIKAHLFFDSFLAHPTVMMRRKTLDSHKLRYDHNDLCAEDYGLWVRCSFLFPLANIPEVLLKYRISPNSIGQTYGERQRATVLKIHKDNVSRLGIMLNDECFEIHKIAAFPPAKITDTELIQKIENWLITLRDANIRSATYPEQEFSRAISNQWFVVCCAATDLGIWTWIKFWQSSLIEFVDLSSKARYKFAYRCCLGMLKSVKKRLLNL